MTSEDYGYVVSVEINKERDKYDWNPFSSNQCRTFSKNAFEAAQK